MDIRIHAEGSGIEATLKKVSPTKADPVYPLVMSPVLKSILGANEPAGKCRVRAIRERQEATRGREVEIVQRVIDGEVGRGCTVRSR